MGWTGYNATHYKPDGTIDRKAELDYELFGRFDGRPDAHKLLKSSLVGSTYYAAAQKPDGCVYGLVVLTQTDRRDPWTNFYYKDMSEDMGPCESDCPVSILKLLSPTTDDFALAWRERCRENAARKKSPTTLGNLPIGSRIRFECGGAPVELVRHAPAYQFKRPFWYDPERNTYMPARRIPTDYEVIPA